MSVTNASLISLSRRCNRWCTINFSTNAGILLIWLLGTISSEMLIEIDAFSFKKTHLKMSSGKWRPSCLGINVFWCFVNVWVGYLAYLSSHPYLIQSSRKLVVKHIQQASSVLIILNLRNQSKKLYWLRNPRLCLSTVLSIVSHLWWSVQWFVVRQLDADEAGHLDNYGAAEWSKKT